MSEATEKKETGTLIRKGYWPAIAGEYLDEGEYSKVVDLCLRMLDSEPHVVSGRVILARALYHAGQYRQAREQFVRVLKYDASNLVALKYLGDILFRAKEEAAAMAYYRRIFEIDPHCEGLSCKIDEGKTTETRQLTIKRNEETIPRKKRTSLRDPVFITETVGDLYAEQGYLRLASEVYRQLLEWRENSRVEEKLRKTREKLDKKEGTHESPC